MRELSVEEKAKAYDKVREKIDLRFGSNVAEEIFSQFEESEDEKIRKTLIEFFGRTAKYNCSTAGISDKDILVWLEKQGEKSVDKIEPKFKIGDWLASNICNSSDLLHIIDVDDKNYEIETPQGNTGVPSIAYIDNNFHLWTIQDAKDGDVLVMQKTRGTYESIFIFNKIENNRIIQYLHYFITDTDEEVCEARSIDGFLGFVGTNVHPATVEQRDILFQKMKEVGYEWDADKKELKENCYIL